MGKAFLTPAGRTFSRRLLTGMSFCLVLGHSLGAMAQEPTAAGALEAQPVLAPADAIPSLRYITTPTFVSNGMSDNGEAGMLFPSRGFQIQVSQNYYETKGTKKSRLDEVSDIDSNALMSRMDMAMAFNQNFFGGASLRHQISATSIDGRNEGVNLKQEDNKKGLMDPMIYGGGRMNWRRFSAIASLGLSAAISSNESEQSYSVSGMSSQYYAFNGNASSGGVRLAPQIAFFTNDYEKMMFGTRIGYVWQDKAKGTQKNSDGSKATLESTGGSKTSVQAFSELPVRGDHRLGVTTTWRMIEASEMTSVTNVDSRVRTAKSEAYQTMELQTFFRYRITNAISLIPSAAYGWNLSSPSESTDIEKWAAQFDARFAF